MTSPVDLKNLREITDGDVEMERELFKEFITTSDSYIEILSKSTAADTSEKWRATAHSFKGIALNLGAMELAELCKAAQENHTSPTNQKSDMLGYITQQYLVVKDFLNHL